MSTLVSILSTFLVNLFQPEPPPQNLTVNQEVIYVNYCKIEPQENSINATLVETNLNLKNNSRIVIQ